MCPHVAPVQPVRAYAAFSHRPQTESVVHQPQWPDGYLMNFHFQLLIKHKNFNFFLILKTIIKYSFEMP